MGGQHDRSRETVASFRRLHDTSTKAITQFLNSAGLDNEFDCSCIQRKKITVCF
jgi:hypothetical protein